MPKLASSPDTTRPRLVTRTAGSAGGSAAGRLRRETPSLVLIVDDDEEFGDAIGLALEARDHRVVCMRSAVDALAYLEAGHEPDLILLDLIMPDMNGWEFRLEQRRHPTWSRIPVVAISGDDSPHAAAIDARAYLHKPVAEHTFFATVEQVLAERETHRDPEAAAHLEQLSSLGLVAMGVTHEINNPLTCVMGNLDLMRRQVRSLQPLLSGGGDEHVVALCRMLDQMEEGADRIADVVRAVAQFARPDQGPATALNVVEQLENSIALMAFELRNVARLERHYREVPRVLGNASKLGQVFVNLLSHAVTTLRDGAGKAVLRVTVDTSPEGNVAVTFGAPNHGSSTGPFDSHAFPGPTHGASTGLRLSISQRLVEGMGGSLSLRAPPGEGASLRVELPAVPDRNPGTLSSVPPPHSLEAPRLLVIDDEQSTRATLDSLLRGSYAVKTAASASEAGRMLAAESFDVILCDLMMPEKSGADLHAELSLSSPDQAERMVFLTDGTSTPRGQAFLHGRPRRCLERPLSPVQIEAQIRAVLEARGRCTQPRRRPRR